VSDDVTSQQQLQPIAAGDLTDEQLAQALGTQLSIEVPSEVDATTRVVRDQLDRILTGLQKEMVEVLQADPAATYAIANQRTADSVSMTAIASIAIDKASLSGIGDFPPLMNLITLIASATYELGFLRGIQYKDATAGQSSSGQPADQDAIIAKPEALINLG